LKRSKVQKMQEQDDRRSVKRKHSLESNADKISVCIRVRPMNNKELAVSKQPAWRTSSSGNTIYTVNPATGQADASSTVFGFGTIILLLRTLFSQEF